MISLLCTLLIGLSAPSAIQVDGEGYLRFAKDGSVIYAKHVSLEWRDGLIVSQDGDPVWPKIKAESEPKSIEVDLRGRVLLGYSNEVIEAGRLVLALFPDDVRPVESGRYLKIFGDAELKEPGEGLAGVIRPWTGSVASTPEPERSFIKVYETEVEVPVKSKEDSVVAIQRSQKTDHVGDSEWIATGGIEIAFPDESEVSGNFMTLGDVADIFCAPDLKARLAAVDLGNSPVFGVPRQIDRTWILGRLKAAGFAPATVRVVGPVRLTIKRVGQSITQQMFVDAAVREIATQYPGFEPESTKPVPDLDVPVGELQLVAERVAKSGSTLMVTVAAFVDGKRINSRNLTFTNNVVPLSLSVGDTVSVTFLSGAVVIETTGQIKKVDRVKGEVTVQISTGKQVVGTLNTQGKIEVRL